MVVPRSSRQLAEDTDYRLFAVTVFSRAHKDFVRAAHEQKFTVRDFVYDKGVLEQSRHDTEVLRASVQSQWAALVRLVRTSFSEAFAVWLHAKALRLYVESVLRYGLPPHYLFVVLQPHRGKEKKMRRLFLAQLEKLALPGISAIDLAAAVGVDGSEDEVMGTEESELWNQLNMANRDYEPYVKLCLEWAGF